jgi:hypothetical protein
MLTKQEWIFALKLWYKSGFPVIGAQWCDNFDSVPTTCKFSYSRH